MPEPQSTAKIYTTIQGVKVAVWLCVSDVDIALKVEKEENVEVADCGCGIVGIDKEEGTVVLYGGQRPDLGIAIEESDGIWRAVIERDDE